MLQRQDMDWLVIEKNKIDLSHFEISYSGLPKRTAIALGLSAARRSFDVYVLIDRSEREISYKVMTRKTCSPLPFVILL